MTKDNETTDFGFSEISKEEKSARVAEVFHSVANKYDLMNDLMSLGIHRIWKRFTIELSGVRRGHSVLDVAGGTGDLSRHFSRLVGPEGRVVLADINSSMLEIGRDRMLDTGAGSNASFVQADAESLPFADNSFNCISIAFGLRNVTDKQAALKEFTRTLKPGSRLLVLEFSKPKNPILSKAYDSYSFSILPTLGKIIADDSDSYRYLAESIRMHPDQDRLKEMMVQAGLVQCEYHNMTGGVVALHRGIKP